MTPYPRDRGDDAAPPRSAGRLRAAVDLPMTPGAAAQARAVVRELLADWHVDGDLPRYDAMLLTSELVTNAVRHGAPRVTLVVSVEHDAVELAVEDGSAVLPDRCDLGPAGGGEERESGRGLVILAAVAAAWGVDRLPGGGKRVWARLRR